MMEIPLTQDKVALVDDDDFDELSKHKWSVDTQGYPSRGIVTERGWRPVRMHRFILGLSFGEPADHINRDRLDNRRSNLRRCTRQQNTFNRRPMSKSGYKGAYSSPTLSGWRAQIMVNGKCLYLGSFRTPEDAARAYDTAARDHYGEFAYLNFPEHASTHE